MKKALKELWYSYLLENPPGMNGAQRAAVKKITETQEELRALLDEEQKAKLEAYEALLNELSGACEERAFVKGVRFATAFLIAATSEE